MEIDDIAEQIQEYRLRGLSIFSTSSFQSQSVPLLHIISRIDRNIPIYFLNTGYLFPDSLRFRDQLARELGLRVVTIHPLVPKTQQIGSNGNLLFATDPDRCCYLNKVQPLEAVLLAHDVWINGVRADQTAERAAMHVEQIGPHGTLRYHPLLNWTARDVHRYVQEYGLPSHPLEEKGYVSVGCEPCTRPFLDSLEHRSGRWFGMKKRECGLHTALATDASGGEEAGR